LFWNADSSIGDGYLFNPVLTVTGQVPELSNLLVYVTNEESNNVSVLNRQTGDVVAAVMVGKKPRGIAVSHGRERPRVYVANSDSDSISVIDPTTNKVEAEIPIRFGRAPEGITVVRISPDRELIFTANYASDNVSVIDAATYQEIDKINTGDGPIAITADPPADLLSSSRFLNFEDLNFLRNYRQSFFNVYTANKNSKDVSVIKMNALTGRFEGVVFQVAVQWSPITLATDYQRGKVYVGNYNYDNLSVLDMTQIARGYESGAVGEITNVGATVTGIIADPDLDRIYLLKEASSEIMVIRPFSEAFGAIKTSMGPVIGTIAVGNSPRSFIMDPEGRKLYVVNRGSDSVSVVDKTTSREEKVIPVGKKPYGIAMFPY
jgi:YVTN family beta-propeller protein